MDIYKFARALFCCAYTCFFLNVTQILAFEPESGVGAPHQHEWVERYFNSLDETASIQETVDFLFSLQTSLESMHYFPPSLSELCIKMREYLNVRDVEINETIFEKIYSEISLRESGAIVPANNFDTARFILIKKSKEEGIEVSDGFAIGFMKALGGALLCVIPHPATIAVGGALVADGIKDMVQHAGDASNNISPEDRLRQYRNPSN